MLKTRNKKYPTSWRMRYHLRLVFRNGNYPVPVSVGTEAILIILAKVSQSFPHSLQEISAYCFKLDYESFLSYELLTASLNKLQTNKKDELSKVCST
jgi:hypothetical protein